MGAPARFKVGDKVKIVRPFKGTDDVRFNPNMTYQLGLVGTVMGSSVPGYYFVGTGVEMWNWHESSLEHAEPVKADIHQADEAPEWAGFGPEGKDTNPKDMIGDTKLNLGLVPDTLQVMAALAFTEGATKYGSYNWRVAGIRNSVYHAALKRHLAKWWNGEDKDETTGVPHLASVIACAAIILDATLAGKATDDRPPKAAVSELIDSMVEKVAHLKEMHKDKNPHHHTALDQK